MTSGPLQPHQLHEIPNVGVVDAAEQFHAGYQLLRKAPLQAGVLLPMLQAGAVAMELYLKSLAAREDEVQEHTFSPVVTVYAKAKITSHDPVALYGEAPPVARTAIDAEIARDERLSRYGGAVDVLKAHAKLFQSSRYPYERQSTFDGVTMEGLDALLLALQAAVRRTPSHLIP